VKGVASVPPGLFEDPDCDAAGWSYQLPQCWTTNYPVCGGRTQSPVNLDLTGGYAAVGEVDLTAFVHYKALEDILYVENTGHGLKMTNTGDMGMISLDGEDFEVDHLQFHCPSEHTIDGKTFDCELQVTHSDRDSGKMLIMAIFYTADGLNSNPLISKMGLPSFAPAYSSSPPLAVVGGLNLANEFTGLIRAGFFRYDGSLTEPPCTEGVTWFLLGTPLKMTRQQLESFKLLPGFNSPANNRPVQLMNGRAMFKDTLPGCFLEGHKRRLKDTEEAEWGYIMPQCWPVAYPLCATGTDQSPINIDTSIVDPPGFLNLGLEHGTIDNAVMFNAGMELRVNHPNGTVSYDGLTYSTIQFHFKFGSEHALDGKIYAAELCIVHQQQGASDRNNLLVISVLFDIGQENAFLRQLGFHAGNELPSAPGVPGISVGQIRIDDVLQPLMVDGYYNYHGSITTPPCEETVGWIVMAGVLELSKAQYDMGKLIIPDPLGKRPLQDLNGRHIGKNGKPYGYPAPLPVNTWLDQSHLSSNMFVPELDEINGAVRATLLGSSFAVLLALCQFLTRLVQ